MNLYSQIKSLGACPPALDWIEKNPDMTLQEAWDKCPNPRWMVWLLRKSKSKIETETWQRLAFNIAETVIHLMPIESQECMVEIKKYLDGDTSIDIVAVRKRSAAAYSAAAYADAAAAYAADVVAYAAYSAAAAAADAAAAAAADAAADAADDAKICNVIRKRFPVAPVLQT